MDDKPAKDEEQLDPVSGTPWERGTSPYTVEGYIADFGRFARGTIRAEGWRGKLARVIVLAILANLAVGAVWGLFALIRGL